MLIVPWVLLEFNICFSGLAFKVRLLLNVACAFLPALLPAAGIAEFQSDTSSFSGEVAATCAFSDLESTINLANTIVYTDVPRLQSSYRTFYVVSNVEVKVAVEYEIIAEPAGFAGEYRWLYFRQKIGGVGQSNQYLKVPNVQAAPLVIGDTPGTATMNVGMFVQPTSVPGDYEYRVTFTCLL